MRRFGPQVVQQAADGILGHHDHVDILVASAGTNIGKRFWKDVTPGGWDQVVTADLNGVTYSILAVLPSMRARKEGPVIIISSWGGTVPGLCCGAGLQRRQRRPGCGRAVVQDGRGRERPARDRHYARGGGHAAPEEASGAASARRDRSHVATGGFGRNLRFVAGLPPQVCVNRS
jgi:short chain dehydrogenase